MIPNAVCKRTDEQIGSGSALSSPKLAEAELIRKLAGALDERQQKYFHYGSIHGGALVLHFDHPGIVREFAGTKEDVLRRMRQIFVDERMQGKIWFRDIAARLKPKQQTTDRGDDAPHERSSGEFAILTQDEQLRKSFERIQTRIRENRAKEHP